MFLWAFKRASQSKTLEYGSARTWRGTGSANGQLQHTVHSQKHNKHQNIQNYLFKKRVLFIVLNQGLLGSQTLKDYSRRTKK